MTAAERGGDAVGIFDALHQHVDAIRSPEQFAVKHHGGHTEHAECFGVIDDAIVLGAGSAVYIALEFGGRTAERSNDAGNLSAVSW